MIKTLSLKKAIWVLSIFCLITPFFVGPFLYFPFITLKASLFRIFVEIMFLLWVIYFIKEKKPLSFFKNSIILSFSLFLFVLFLASLLGLSFYQSFFSSTERLEGLFGILHFYIFLLILVSIFEKKEIEDLLKISIYLALFYSFFSILYFFIPEAFGSPIRFDRLTGFAGNPSYYAVYLLFHSFFALYFYFKKFLLEKKFFNFYFLIFLIFTILIILNATRGVMVGYTLGILLISFLIIFKQEKSKEFIIFKKIAFSLIIILSLLIFTLFALRNSTFVQSHLFLKRLTTFNFNDPATKSRLISYQIALKSFKERPILGWGGESYIFLYTKNFDPEMPKVLPDFMFDRVHNKILEILVDAGLIGLISYLFIYYFIFKVFKKKIKDSFYLTLPFIGLIVSYFVQNLFIFDFHESYLLFTLTLAFLSFDAPFINIKNFSKLNNKDNQKKEFIQDFSRDFFKIFIYIVCFSGVIFSLYRFIFTPMVQYYYLIKANKEFVLKRPEEGIKTLKKILYYHSPYQLDAVYGSKRIYDSIKSQITNDERKKLLDLYYQEGKNILETRRPHYQFLLNYTDLMMDLAELDSSKKEIAKNLIERLEKEAPNVPYTVLAISKYHLLLEHNISKAKEYLEKAEKMTEFIPDTYYILFLLHHQLNNQKLADEYLMKAIEKGRFPNKKQLIYYAANLFVPKKDYETIIKIYSYGIKLYPKEAEFYVKLAAAYGKLKNKEKAIEYTKKAMELMPSLKEEAEKFIDLINREQWDKIPD